MKNLILTVFAISCSLTTIYGQTLEDFLNENEKEKVVSHTFYSSRIINSHTTESIEKKVLDFRINHRFGILTDAYSFFGLDAASMRIGFDYGITDNITVGIGRSTFEKTIDGFAKYRILRQTQKNTVPLSLAYVAGISMNGLKWADPTRTNYFTSRLSYVHQLLIAKKFTDKFSLQLMPTIIHRNLIDSSVFKNTVWSVGVGLRQSISPSVTLNLEYFYVGPKQISSQIKHPLSLGIDINTGSHTFQLHITNATATFEQGMITQTRNRWLYKDSQTINGSKWKSQLHFGFNISREFELGEY